MVWLVLTIVFTIGAFMSFFYNFWVLGAIFVLLNISLLWTWKLGAAWDPTPMEVIHKILDYLSPKPNDIVYDLGCGDGRFVIEAARRYGCRAVGIEIDPLRYLISLTRVRLLGLSDRVKIIWKNFFDYPLNDANIVFCFLTEEANRKLEVKFSKELPYGTFIVSYLWRFYGFNLVNVIDDKIFFYLV